MAAEGWTASSCTAGTPNTTPEAKPFVFGVIPQFVYHIESATLCCSDVTTIVGVVDGIEQMLKTFTIKLV